MARLSVTIQNDESSDYNCHVYDLFGGGRREVDGSPFPLQSGSGNSRTFYVEESGGGGGLVEYSCDGGPELTNISVSDGDTITIR